MKVRITEAKDGVKCKFCRLKGTIESCLHGGRLMCKFEEYVNKTRRL